MNRKQGTFALVALALMALLAVMIAPALAQDTPVPPQQRVISVSGLGQAYGAPDIAYLEVGVMETDSEVSAAFTRANDKMQQVRQALIDLGIAEADLQTTNISVYANNNYDPQTGMPTETITYQVSNTLRVTVRDITQVSTVINAAVEAGANQLYGLSFGIADTSALEQQAREAAVANARERAEQLAGLLNVTVGEPVVISETYGNVGPFPTDVRNMAMEGMGGAGAPVDTGRMMVQVQVNVTFAIGG